MKIIAQYVWGSLDYYGAEIDKYTEHLLDWFLVWQNIKYVHSYVCSFAILAQLVEQGICNAQVVSSILTDGSTFVLF